MINVEAILYYDGECPFCNNYLALLRVRESLGNLDVRNARSYPEDVLQMNAKGYDIDDGMILIIGEKYYYGPECVAKLAALSEKRTVFEKLNGVIFSGGFFSTAVYSVLVRLRKCWLWISGHSRIIPKEHQKSSVLAPSLDIDSRKNLKL